MTTLTPSRLTPAELAAEVEHLLSFGVWPEQIATQVGYQGRLRALRSYLEKYRRQDLATQLRIPTVPRECKAPTGWGSHCRQPPLTGRDVCRMHAKADRRG